MIIEERVKNVLLKELDIGEVFRCGSKYFLKIPPCESSGYEYNFYDLALNDYGYLSPEKSVTPVKAKLVIE